MHSLREAKTDRVVESFAKYFRVVWAATPELIDEAYRIRYSVYAEELAWESRAEFQNCRESDAFDGRAAHCLLEHRPTKKYIGCVRLVTSDRHDPSSPFPFELALQAAGAEVDLFGDADMRKVCGEISRIAVVSQYRHRRGEKTQPHTEIGWSPVPDRLERRGFPNIGMGLYLAAAALGLIRGMDRVYAIMEPKLVRRLRSYGMQFEQIGPAFEHHGERIPFQLEREGFVPSLRPSVRALLEHIREELRSQTPTLADHVRDP